ncbi:MAG: PBP1A family penicillin-binding protein [Patescibacteria group bacterium]
MKPFSFVSSFFRWFGKEEKKKTTKLLLVIGGVFFVFILGLFVYIARDLPSPGKINTRFVPESTKIYDRGGKILLYEIHGEVRRTLVSLDQISNYVIGATIAAEDRNFYKHHGFSIRGITRAIFKNVKPGDELQGGSTITQQFVKNSILTSERTFTRKIKELILAIEIELKFKKDEILQMYLNEIPYGSNAYGIEAAAQTFFGKKAKDLTLAESAVLAALPRAPTYYSPYGNNFNETKTRQEWILDRMADDKLVSRQEADMAKKEELKFLEKKEGILAPHFVMYVREKLTEKYGEKFVIEGGLKVYTTLDMDLQKIAEEAVVEGGKKNEQYGARNAALVALDPKTGQILAMQGSRDYFDKDNDGNVNVAIRDRQPGSSFKPFAYARAFQKGYTPETILFDLVTDFGNNYKPQDYDRGQRGPVSMRQALAGSLNIPAVKTLYLAGVKETIDLAHQMGITTLNAGEDRYGLSLVLGGGEVKLLDMVSAFGVFAQNGMRYEETPILKIIDKNGKVLENNEEPSRKEVLDSQIARLITNVLSDNGARAFIFGSASPLVLPDRPVAAKTGTTEEFRDAWTIGYTPSLAAGVWVGNNDNHPMKIGSDGVYVAAPIWHDFMVKALAGKPSEEFQRPEPTNPKKPILAGKMAEETKVKICKPKGLLATDRCPKHLVEERVYRKVHSILYYVDKDNPQGPYPSNPASDPQFSRWEGPVLAWAKANNIYQEDPPKDYDDTHDEKNQPRIEITSPGADYEIISSPVLIKAQANAPLGIKKVEFYIDGALVGTDTTGPYAINYDFFQIANGGHTIRAVVYDPVDNIAETSVSISVNLERVPKISLTSPAGNLSLVRSQFPFLLQANAFAEEGINNVKFYASENLVDRVFPQASGEQTFSAKWSYPGKGVFSVYAVVLDNNGRTAYSRNVKVTVK